MIPKILWSSVSPDYTTGYGKVTANLATRFKERGIDIILHGYQNKNAIRDYKGIKVLPNGEQNYGMDVLRDYFKRYKRDILITLYDIWAAPNIPNLSIPFCPYVPIDASPVTPPTSEPLIYAMKVIAMAEYGKQELEKVDIPSVVIPHGFDSKIFHPVDIKRKKELKRSLGLKSDDFLIGTVCVNLLDRKDIPRMIKAFSLFLKRTKAKNAYFFLLTDKKGKVGTAYSIEGLASLYGVSGRVLYPEKSPFLNPLPEEGLAELYQSFDVYIALSRAEGWNLPLSESAACGVPGIFTDYSAPPTWYPPNFGWRIPVIDKIVSLTTILHNEWALADVNKAAEAIKEAYQDREKLYSISNKLAEAMLKYDWDKVVDDYWIPFLENIQKDLTQPYDLNYFKNREEEERDQDIEPLEEEMRGKSVLELRCGDGEFLRILKSKGFEVAGCDISEVAQGFCKDLNVKVLNVEDGLPYEDNSFDTVVSMHLLEHCENDIKVINESVRVARKRAVHLVPLGLRKDWRHKRVYYQNSILINLMPTKLIILPCGDAILIYDKDKLIEV